jgi:hypothetical protein
LAEKVATLWKAELLDGPRMPVATFLQQVRTQCLSGSVAVWK